MCACVRVCVREFACVLGVAGWPGLKGLACQRGRGKRTDSKLNLSLPKAMRHMSRDRGATGAMPHAAVCIMRCMAGGPQEQ